MDKVSNENRTVGIIGGGAAGMSCALWLKRLGHDPVIVEQRPALGGQLQDIERTNRWVLGSRNRSSPELAVAYAEHVVAENIRVLSGTRVIGLASNSAPWDLIVEAPDGHASTLCCARLVIATGTRVRTHEALGYIAGFAAVRAAGLISFWPLDHLGRPEALHDKRIAVIGGGDNAHFTVADLASLTDRLFLLSRSRPGAQPSIRATVEGLIESGRVVEYPGVEIVGLVPLEGGVQIDASQAGTGSISIEVDMIFARTGFMPNTDFLATLGPLAELARNTQGYLLTDAGKRTSLANVYAIGDVANPDYPAVVVSVADGAIAARAIIRDAATLIG